MGNPLHEPLILNGRAYTEQELKTGLYRASNRFEELVLNFCQNWINGQQHIVVHTSGSTGTPKPHTITREEMVDSALRIQTKLNLQPSGKALLCLDPTTIAGQMVLVRSLVLGLQTYAINPCADPLNSLPQTGIQFETASLVPYQISRTLETNPIEKLAQIKNILIGGAPISPSLREKISTAPSAVYATYGMTETIATIALQKLNGIDRQETFHTLPGISIKTNEQECLIISLENGKEVITRDIVSITGQGRFTWLGRLDHVINTGGIKIIPEQIEQMVRAWFEKMGIPNDFFIGSLPHPALGEQICLFIEGALPNTLHTSELDTLKEVLPKYASPKKIYLNLQFTRTALGKLNRKETLSSIRANDTLNPIHHNLTDRHHISGK